MPSRLQWGSDILGSCSDGGFEITSETFSIKRGTPEKLKFEYNANTKQSMILNIPEYYILLSDENVNHIRLATNEDTVEQFIKCESGVFKIIKTERQDNGFSLALVVDSEEGINKNIQLVLSPKNFKIKDFEFFESNIGKKFTIQYETHFFSEDNSKINIVQNIKIN